MQELYLQVCIWVVLYGSLCGTEGWSAFRYVMHMYAHKEEANFVAVLKSGRLNLESLEQGHCTLTVPAPLSC